MDSFCAAKMRTRGYLCFMDGERNFSYLNQKIDDKQFRCHSLSLQSQTVSCTTKPMETEETGEAELPMRAVWRGGPDRPIQR